ncbi:serine hydrolase [Halobaculum magnesiiphilum]|uniref:Serine hydrolase n=1 Tax=Halobaculum magnesiiphilum TaxID=1017351 RepID=A0A8T8WAH7_9EURY|nr:serine hydrolase [Halobaculum magnesiiphilum]QZP36826.1 serine hydrolase [Halobaculum magnesiiphilum]
MNDEGRAAAADLIRRTMRRDRLPGVSVAVVDRDGVRYAEGFGARDLAGNRPATPETLYGVGSVTKSVTALAIAQLAEAGMLDFDDPVSDHLDVDLGDDPDDPIRLRHLLSHASGVPSLATSEALIGRRLRRDTDTLPLSTEADFRAHVEGAVGGDGRGGDGRGSDTGGDDTDGAGSVGGGSVGGDAAGGPTTAGTEHVGAPGERFAYSNEGYVLLGDVIEACTGRPYDRYVAEHALDPLGLDRATFDDTAFAMDDDHATMYLREDRGSGPAAAHARGGPAGDAGGRDDLVAASVPVRELSRPAGGLFASVEGLGRYARLLLNDGSLDGREVVSPESVAALTEGRVDTPGGPYGFGWRTRESCGRELVGHSGSIAVSTAYVGFSPEAGIGVAVAANAAPGYPLVRLGEGVFACALGEEPSEAVPFFERRRRFDRLAGEYASYRGVKRAIVTRDGGGLRLELAGPLGGESLPLTEAAGDDPHAFTTSNEAGERVPVEFRVGDEDGGGDDRAGGDAGAASDGGRGVDLLYDRWHLHKVADDPEASL